MPLRSMRIVCAALLLAACGASESAEPEASPAPPAASGGELAAPPEHGGMQVQGTLGTIPQRRIDEVMQAKLAAFQRFFFQGSAEVELLGGRFEFYVRVAADGSVEDVYPRASTVGHRSTELCLLGVVHKARFPRPQGGSGAEFAWDFEVDPVGGGRPPVAWGADRIVTEVRQQRGALAACGLDAGRYTVTAYVAEGGSVLGAGAAANSPEAAQNLDCIVNAVRAFRMPDPGSYPAKVSFEP